MTSRHDQHRAVVTGTARSYAAWAEIEASGSSPLYEDWAGSLARDPAMLSLVDSLPPRCRQPNLVFAAARVAGVPLRSYDEVRD